MFPLSTSAVSDKEVAKHANTPLLADRNVQEKAYPFFLRFQSRFMKNS